jgi:hypothetical protein
MTRHGQQPTEEEAAWIRAVAWRNHHRKTYAEAPAIYSMCDCQLGACGHCTAGRHHACAHNTWSPGEATAAYLTNRAGLVVAEVWEAGHRHVWTCRCKATSGLPDHDPRPEQMALF